MMSFRLWLARKILGKHCACYRMGYHNLCDYKQQAADAVELQKLKNNGG